MTPEGWFRIGIRLLLLALAVHFTLPQLAGLEATGEALARSTLWAGFLALGLEAASLWSYGELVLGLLRATGEPAPRWVIQRGTLVQNALARSLPGGSMAGLPIVVDGLHRSGLSGPRSTTALAGAGLLSTIVLAALLPTGALLALVGGVRGGVSGSAALLSGAVLVGAVALRRVLRRPEAAGRIVSSAVRLVDRGPLRKHLDPDRVGAAVAGGVRELDGVAKRPGLLARSALWAAANWLFDAAALFVIAATIGSGTPLAAVLVVYVVGQLVAALPLTPGGVGLVEATMIGAFVAAGAPAGAATATVLGWRLVSHWLPIPVGLAFLPTMRRPVFRHRARHR